IGANISSQFSLRSRIGDQDRQIGTVGIKICSRALVGFNKTVLAGKKVSTFFLLHLDDRAIEFWQEIEYLRRLTGPVLIVGALIESDLLFVLKRLQNVARFIQKRISEA